MKYEKARAEVVLFDNSDVITASEGSCSSPLNSFRPDQCNGGYVSTHYDCKWGLFTSDSGNPDGPGEM